LQFARIFKLLRRPTDYHGFVNAGRDVENPSLHIIDRGSLTPRAAAYVGDCPVFAPLARRFPFSAPLRPRGAVFLRPDTNFDELEILE